MCHVCPNLLAKARFMAGPSIKSAVKVLQVEMHNLPA